MPASRSRRHPRPVPAGRRSTPKAAKVDDAIARTLEETRSVGATARRHDLAESEVQRVALLLFGLGRLNVDLVDF